MKLEKITTEYLVKNQWMKGINGGRWLLELGDKAIELIEGDDVYYPTILQFPEMSHQQTQRVSINMITSIEEIEAIIKIIK